MARTVVPIKIIVTQNNGAHVYPQWSQLGIADYNSHVFVRASENKRGFDHQTAPDSPVGVWIHCLGVSQLFAREALLQFPTLVSLMTETEFEDFYDNRAMSGVGESKRDTGILESMKAERDLRVSLGQDLTALDAEILKSIDPDSPEPGVRRRRQRRWSMVKSDKDLIVGTP